MKIGYIPTKETAMRSFFINLPKGDNLFLLWQKFGYVDVQEREDNIDAIVFKLIHIFDPETINGLINGLAVAFRGYTLTYRPDPAITITMKPDMTMTMPTVPKGLIDNVVTTKQSKEQNSQFISSLGFSI